MDASQLATRLRLALANLIGQELTPEAAARIETFVLAELPVAVHDFPPKEFKGYVFAYERAASILQELHVLHARHFEETEVHRHEFGMNPDYAGGISDEQDGNLLQFSMRYEGQLVGHIRFYLTRCRHTGAKQAVEDALFVLPEHRKGLVAVRFWQYAEACAKSIGVREMSVGTKPGVNDAHRLYEYLGYRLVAHKLTKIL